MRALNAFAAVVSTASTALLGASFAACAHGAKPPPQLYPGTFDHASGTVDDRQPPPGTRFDDWPVIDGGEGQTTDAGETPASDPEPGNNSDRFLWEGPPPPAAQEPLRTHRTQDEAEDRSDRSDGGAGGGHDDAERTPR